MKWHNPTIIRMYGRPAYEAMECFLFLNLHLCIADIHIWLCKALWFGLY